MTLSTDTPGKADQAEGTGLVAGPLRSDDMDFSLWSFAILTSQEYSYHAHTKSIDALLCKASRLHGDHHA